MFSFFNLKKQKITKEHFKFVVYCTLTCSVVVSSIYGWISNYLFHLHIGFFSILWLFIFLFSIVFFLVPNSLISFIKILESKNVHRFVNTVNKFFSVKSSFVNGIFLYLLLVLEPLYFKSPIPSFTLFILIVSILRAFFVFPSTAFYNLYNSKYYEKYLLLNNIQKAHFHGTPTPKMPSTGNINPEIVLDVVKQGGTAALGVLGAIEAASIQHVNGIQDTTNRAVGVTQTAQYEAARIIEKKEQFLGQVIRDNKNEEKCEQILMARHELNKVFEIRDVALMHEQKLIELQNNINGLGIVDSIKETFTGSQDSLQKQAQSCYTQSMDIKIQVLDLEKPNSIGAPSDVAHVILENFYNFFQYFINLLCNII
jgi:hypothetical protein